MSRRRSFMLVVVLITGAAGCGGVAARGGDPVAAGKRIHQQRRAACHTTSGKDAVGPPWKGSYGKPVGLADGSAVVVDDGCVERSIRDPQAPRVAGFTANMRS